MHFISLVFLPITYHRCSDHFHCIYTIVSISTNYHFHVNTLIGIVLNGIDNWFIYSLNLYSTTTSEVGGEPPNSNFLSGSFKILNKLISIDIAINIFSVAINELALF